MDELEMYKAILDSFPYPIVFADADHIIRYLNKTARYKYYEMRGYDELIGKSLFDCHNDLSREKITAGVEKLKNAQSVVICSYSGLTVEQVTEIRKQCRENDAAYCVLKNRLVLRALNEVGITGLDDLLNGPNAFVFSMKDAVSGPKIINDYIEKNKLESLKITGGVLGTETLDVAAVKHLATLPSREVLLAKLLGCMTNTVASFVRVVDAIRKQKNGEE